MNWVSPQVDDNLERIGGELPSKLQIELCFVHRDGMNAVAIEFLEDEVMMIARQIQNHICDSLG